MNKLDKIDILFIIVILIGLLMFIVGFSMLSSILTVGGIVLVFASIPVYELITDYQVKYLC